MTDQNNLQPTTSRVRATVLRRVRTIHMLQPLFSAMALSLALFVAALWGIGREVWVARVFQDEPSLTNFSAVFHFYLAAFLDTRLIVQVLSVVVVAALVWLVYSFVSMTRHSRISMQFA